MRTKVAVSLLGVAFLWNISAVPVDTDQEVVAIVRDSIYYEQGVEEADGAEEAIYAYIPQVTLTD